MPEYPSHPQSDPGSRSGSAPSASMADVLAASNTPIRRVKRNGGPNTEAGKRISSANAVKSAIFARDPTAGGESADEYQTSLVRLREYFDPIGEYQEQLVTAIAREFLTLDRITRATQGAIDRAWAKVKPPEPPRYIEDLGPRLKWWEFKRPLHTQIVLEHLDGADPRDLDEAVVHDVVLALKELGVEVVVPEANVNQENQAEFLKRLISDTATANDDSPESLVIETAAILEWAFQYAWGADEKVKGPFRQREQRADRAARAHLPDLDEYDRLVKYKRSAERSLKQYMDMLETAKRAAAGELEPRLRIQLTSDSEDERAD